jgi:hypothetical protein
VEQPADPNNDSSSSGGSESQREKFEAREIAQVLSHYDLGVIARIREYRRGSRRAAKLKLDTERGEFLLKRKAATHTRERARARWSESERASDRFSPMGGTGVCAAAASPASSWSLRSSIKCARAGQDASWSKLSSAPPPRGPPAPCG